MTVLNFYQSNFLQTCLPKPEQVIKREECVICSPDESFYGEYFLCVVSGCWDNESVSGFRLSDSLVYPDDED